MMERKSKANHNSELATLNSELTNHNSELGSRNSELKLTINQWAEEDRPREKLMRLGAEALSNAELLAILIGSGSTKESAVALMQHVLKDCNNNLNTLGKRSIRQLMEYNGVGEAKAITILAACELGKRRQQEKAEERTDLGTATAIYNYMHPRMQDLDVEEAWVLLMNQNHKLIKAVRISHGGISETAVDVRIIMREAVLNNATILALCHNHPSNNIRPSSDDDRLTKRVKQACEVMRIFFLDHLIITDGQYYSYYEQGRL
jgi:DNA repair protein RadC